MNFDFVRYVLGIMEFENFRILKLLKCMGATLGGGGTPSCCYVDRQVPPPQPGFAWCCCVLGEGNPPPVWRKPGAAGGSPPHGPHLGAAIAYLAPRQIETCCCCGVPRHGTWCCWGGAPPRPKIATVATFGGGHLLIAF